MSTTRSPPELLQKPNESHGEWLLRRIWDRVNRKNMHFMGCMVGAEGSGKSGTALKIAAEIDPAFDADSVIFDVMELLKILRDGDHQPGDFYVLDEAGVQLGRRTWQERSQVLANQALQIIRDHNLGLIFTIPRLGELDSQTEGRLQATYEITEKVDQEYVTGKWKWMDPDRMDSSGTIKTPFPRRNINGRVRRITRFSFRPPPAGLWEAYQAQKDGFQQEFYDETIRQMEDGEESEEEQKTVKELAMEIAENGVEKYISRHKATKQPYINKELIRADKEISHADATAVRSVLDQHFSESELEELA